MHATIEVLLETVFSIQSVQRGYKEANWDNWVSSVLESVRKSSVGSELWCREDLSPEAEEWPLLELLSGNV
jgi:hypothetical protein